MEPSVAIIGAGFAGLCMAIHLEKAGIRSYTIFERGSDVGGTWRDNTYPGAGCDIPSHLYSFSFEKYSSWTCRYPGQSEILGYLRMCADKYSLRPRIRLNTEVTAAAFDETLGRWRVRTRDGEQLFDVLVTGMGQLSRPRLPDIPGMSDFAGVAFHSARWDHSQDLSGRRVAVVGNGSSAAQLIPRIAEVAERVDVFQRTPNWVLPKPDATFGEVTGTAFRYLPFLQRAYREWLLRYTEIVAHPVLTDGWSAPLARRRALNHLRAQVPDPRLRAKLTPGYPIGCRRIIVDSEFYPALSRPNVNVVTDEIVRIAPEGVVTTEGLHPADVIVYATGFLAADFLAPVEITGRRRRRLRQEWEGGAQAYLGIAVPHFPNLFMLYGPNTNLGHTSVVFMIECQVRYVMGCLPYLAERGPMEVTPEAMRAWRLRLGRAMESTVWRAGCTSWYTDATGRVTGNWPATVALYRRITRAPRPAAFRFSR